MTGKTQPTPNGTVRTTQYAYNGLTTTITANVPSATSPHPQLVMTRTHNAAGQLLGTVDALGGETSYRYDGAGNAVLIEGVDGSRVTATYNGFGQRVGSTDPDRGLMSAAYTAAGEVIAQWDERGWGRHWVYDRLGRPTSERKRCQGQLPN